MGVAIAVVVTFFGLVCHGMAKTDKQWGPQETLRAQMPDRIQRQMTPERIKAMEERKQFRSENEVRQPT